MPDQCQVAWCPAPPMSFCPTLKLPVYSGHKAFSTGDIAKFKQYARDCVRLQGLLNLDGYDCISNNLSAIPDAVEDAARESYDPPDAVYDIHDPENPQPDPSIPVLSTTRRIHPASSASSGSSFDSTATLAETAPSEPKLTGVGGQL
ncbi:uncharacterized protein STEHIDRAFT_107664 [Stereum hirsutum FP-91666 SS1]|uniref:uncharacterized protein n=1 Tax=Stereum hirsutum (strain FP-91666) TaxID=721885 RepID=UPI000440B2EF|nr:uncharacterized protein STEHIDRAFT_107664 [Stereum hirsutum FP-91666 SS1]EIM90982.1 hypothetical protein STEHIDRAFT_107664 [Stereum hirsutum FP-91666 SS1]